MLTEQTIKPLEGVSFAEFARIINRTKGYVSQLKTANRLVLTSDGKRVLVDESKARIKLTSDPAKWPLTVHHEAERKRKAEVKEIDELKPDPYDDFMANLLTDSRVEIVAGLMVGVGLSFGAASLAFNEISCCLSDIREAQGFKTTFQDIPNPRDQMMTHEWRTQIKAEIEERARELALLSEEEV